ncbi:MAG: AIR synthase, partial [Caldiserica bacterium]|nr:AIR synthase [Caldisericota bacterium]
MKNNKLPLGKLPFSLLDKLLSSIPLKDKRILSGPGIGRDVAVIEMGDKFLAMKTDPITLSGDLQ